MSHSMVSRERPPAKRLPALRWARGTIIWGGFAFLVLFGVLFLIRDSLKYIEWTEAVYRRFWPQRHMLAAHALTASICLVIAPLQFSSRLRNRWPMVHRTIGWTYIVGALASGALTFRLGFFSSCRLCVPPFVIWSALFFIVTALGVLMAVRRQFDAHRQFMIRSWVLMNGFVFVRLDTYFPYPFPTGEGIERPAMLIWAVWVVPLLLTEMFLNWSPLVRRSLAASRKARV
ncbi:MAG: DUF2306 domain-containing protein [Gemmatimonadales bacterium]